MQKLGPRQQKFVDELRSGNWPQAKTYLHSNEGYCCLGIATEVVCGLVPTISSDHPSELGVRMFSSHPGTYAGTHSVLPAEAVKMMMFHNSDGGSPLSDAANLWQLNDGADSRPRMTFAEIADYIEADPARVFAGEA